MTTKKAAVKDEPERKGADEKLTDPALTLLSPSPPGGVSEGKPASVGAPADAIPEPPPDHPRFKEIYGKMKEYERGIAEKDKDILAIKEHNKALQEALDKIEDRDIETARPDPVEKPEEFVKWIEAKVKRDYEKEQRAKAATPVTNDPKLNMQIIAASTIYADYNDMVKEVQSDIDNDPILRNQIWGSPNPPIAAYKYGLEKRARNGGEDNARKKQGYVEGGSPHEGDRDRGGLTPDQEKMAARLGIPKDKYKKQLDAIITHRERSLT